MLSIAFVTLFLASCVHSVPQGGSFLPTTTTATSTYTPPMSTTLPISLPLTNSNEDIWVTLPGREVEISNRSVEILPTSNLEECAEMVEIKGRFAAYWNDVDKLCYIVPVRSNAGGELFYKGNEGLINFASATYNIIEHDVRKQQGGIGDGTPDSRKAFFEGCDVVIYIAREKSYNCKEFKHNPNSTLILRKNK